MTVGIARKFGRAELTLALEQRKILVEHGTEPASVI
jgi:hypothetical protein